MTTRRGFITGLISFAVTAPAIVRATSLMPIKGEAMVLSLSDLDRIFQTICAMRVEGSLAGTSTCYLNSENADAIYLHRDAAVHFH